MQVAIKVSSFAAFSLLHILASYPYINTLIGTPTLQLSRTFSLQGKPSYNHHPIYCMFLEIMAYLIVTDRAARRPTMSNPTSTSALQSASTQQPLKTKCTQFMEAHYGGNFIEQSSKTWIPTTPEILMSDKSLGLALMGQTNPLLETTNKGTHVDMLDKKLYACLMELAEKGTGSLLVFFESSYARVFRFVECKSSNSRFHAPADTLKLINRQPGRPASTWVLQICGI